MIKDILKRTAKEVISLNLIRAVVTNVDVERQVCDVEPLNGDAPIFDVRLKAVEDSKESGIVVFPAKGSDVIVALTDGTETDAFVILQEQFDSVLISIQGVFKCTLDNQGNLVLNGGQNQGIVKLPVLQQEVAKINLFLTTLRNAIQAAPIVPGDGGASFKASVSAAIASLQTADLSQAGNDKIKH